MNSFYFKDKTIPSVKSNIELDDLVVLNIDGSKHIFIASIVKDEEGWDIILLKSPNTDNKVKIVFVEIYKCAVKRNTNG